MIYDFNSLIEVLPTILISFLLFSIFYRKYYSSIYDPIFYNIVIYLSFSTSLMFIVNSDNSYFILKFLISQFTFYLGFIFFNKFYKNRFLTKSNYKLSKLSLQQLALITLITFIIITILNCIIIAKQGIVLFSESPTEAKVDAFAGGLGILRRVLWTLSPFSIIGSIILILAKYYRKIFIYILLISVVFVGLSGSKGALVIIVFYIYILTMHKVLKGSIISKTFKKILPFLFILAISLAIYILYIENDSFELAFYSLINRLLFNGDVVIYYYDPIVQQYFQKYTFLNFLPDALNGPLGMLRLVPYKLPLGFQMVYEYNRCRLPYDTILGPNTPFYIVADLYFGLICGSIYSFFTGAFIAYCRLLFQKNRKNAVSLALSTWFYMCSFTFLIEFGLFIGRVFEMFVFFLPIYCFVYLIYYKRSKN